MAELVDALVSGTSDRNIVQVLSLFWAQKRVSGFPLTLFCALGAYFCPIPTPLPWKGLVARKPLTFFCALGAH